MPSVFEYDICSRSICLKRFGTILPGELSESILNISELPNINEAKNLLIVNQNVDLSKISSSEVKYHALFCNEKLNHLNFLIVAPRDLTFGLVRMFDTFAEKINITIVRDISEALKILGLNEIPKIFMNEDKAAGH